MLRGLGCSKLCDEQVRALGRSEDNSDDPPLTERGREQARAAGVFVSKYLQMLQVISTTTFICACRQHGRCDIYENAHSHAICAGFAAVYPEGVELADIADDRHGRRAVCRARNPRDRAALRPELLCGRKVPRG